MWGCWCSGSSWRSGPRSAHRRRRHPSRHRRRVRRLGRPSRRLASQLRGHRRVLRGFLQRAIGRRGRGIQTSRELRDLLSHLPPPLGWNQVTPFAQIAGQHLEGFRYLAEQDVALADVVEDGEMRADVVGDDELAERGRVVLLLNPLQPFFVVPERDHPRIVGAARTRPPERQPEGRQTDQTPHAPQSGTPFGDATQGPVFVLGKIQVAVSDHLDPARSLSAAQSSGGTASCASCSACAGNQAPAAGSIAPQSGSKVFCASPVTFHGL